MRWLLLSVLLLPGTAFGGEPLRELDDPKAIVDQAADALDARLAATEAAHQDEHRLLMRRIEMLQLELGKRDDDRLHGIVGWDGGPYLQLARGKGPGRSIASRGIFDERPEHVNELSSVPFELAVGIGVQARYTGLIRAGLPNQSGFTLARAQLGLRAVVLGWFEVAALFDFGQEYIALGAGGMVRDLYIDVRPTRWLTVRAGQLKVPLGREQLVSGMRLLFPDRSIATRALTFDRDLGVMAEARLWDDRLRIDAAVTDGVDAGKIQANDNIDLAYTVRVVAQPLGPMALDQGDLSRSSRPLVSVGIAAQYSLVPTDLPTPIADVNRDGRRDNVELVTAAVEVAFRWHGFAFEGEYLFRHERRGGGFPDRSLHGGYGQVSMAPWRGLLFGARASYADLPTTRVALSLPGVAARRVATIGGLAGYTFFGHALKALLTYEYRLEAPDESWLNAHQIEAQLQAGF